MPAVTVDDSALLGVLTAFKALDREVQKNVQKVTKGTLQPMFREVYQERTAEAAGRSGGGSSRQDFAMAGPGTVSITGSGKGTLRGYTSSRPLTGGMVPSRNWPFVEFGSKGPWAEYGRLPYYRKGGRIFYPTVKSFAPVAQRAFMWAVYEALRSIPEVSNA
jgi:hypothetical protein